MPVSWWYVKLTIKIKNLNSPLPQSASRDVSIFLRIQKTLSTCPLNNIENVKQSKFETPRSAPPPGRVEILEIF